MSYRDDFLKAVSKMQKLLHVSCATMRALCPEAYAALTSDDMKRHVFVNGPSVASCDFFKPVREAFDCIVLVKRLLVLKDDIIPVIKPYLHGMCQHDLVHLYKAATRKNWCIFRDCTIKTKPFKYYVHHEREFITYGTLEELVVSCADTPLSGIIRYNAALSPYTSSYRVQSMLRFMKAKDIYSLMYNFVSLLMRYNIA